MNDCWLVKYILDYVKIINLLKCKIIIGVFTNNNNA